MNGPLGTNGVESGSTRRWAEQLVSAAASWRSEGRRPVLGRRRFLATVGAASVASWLAGVAGAKPPQGRARFGFVTYLWGKDMDLPTLIDACEKSGLLGVELRTQHRHGVEPTLSKAERLEVRKRFEDSPVTLVGYGSNCQFHEKDPAKVRKNIELAKAYIRLMHDCGGTGVKVKPNGFVKGVPREKTIEQIGRALNEVARFGADYGQRIRLEVHGRGTSELPVIKAILDVADHPNLGVCWNCNPTDLDGQGLEFNFRLVQDRLGDTLHVRELDSDNYPYDRLFRLLVQMQYGGWVLLEARTKPRDVVAAMKEQRRLFEQLVASAGSS